MSDERGPARTRLFTVLMALLFVCSFAALAAAQAAPERDSEGFEAVNGDMMVPGESIPASRLVGAAYGFIFVSVTIWVATVAARTRRVEAELEALKARLAEADRARSTG